MESRTKNSYQTFVQDFTRLDILVSCPGCAKQALVKTGSSVNEKIEEPEVKVTCLHCGYNKKLTDKPSAVLYSSNPKKIAGNYFVIGGAVDPFFHLPLWLIAEIDEHVLWAYNHQHLNFLQTHIEAKLRERNGQERFNSSLGSRLPKWMTSKKNRELLLRKINELRDK